MLRIGLAGLPGRMGQALAAAVAASGACVLAGGIGRPGTMAACLLPDISALAARADVVIDFTHAGTIATHAAALAAAGVPWVLGTTGADETARAAIARAAQSIPVLEAANFSIGVTLLLALAERLGSLLPADGFDAEILEMHHAAKQDAPSGTALALGAAVAAGRGVALDRVSRLSRQGQTGPRTPGEIGFASLRGGAVVGDHSVIFTSGSEQITLSHRAFTRTVFADGALRAAQWLADRPAGLYTLRDMLGL